MARGEGSRADGAPRACCLVSEMLEETGLDRRKARELRRQVLEGMILLCRWQLERMQASAPETKTASTAARKRSRKVAVD